ncbi:hypothetical protein ACC691_40715, partial [Rhizobium johnstonii]|uniref:hypothetical protein n=1 Tax=Rhizobium johnstonii TaxID=3019933 RepID=UPI003F99A6B6
TAYVSAPTLEALPESLSAAITRFVITANAGRLLMFHASGLDAGGDGTRSVIAFVAPSGTGKTTIARVLGQSYGYVSDELV